MRTDPMNTTLVLAGLLILLFNTLLGAARLRRANAYAGLFSVALAVLAGALVAAGITRAAFSGPVSSYGAALLGDLRRLSAIPPIVIAGAGLLIAAAALVVLRVEARQPTFKPGRSSGLLNSGVALFTLVAALIIPFIPLEYASSGVALAPSSTPTPPTPTPSPTATASRTPAPTATATTPATATPLPSLTPTVSETPIILYTPIPYTSTYAVGTTGGCTITAATALNLRGDPSVERAAIGRVFAGSLLAVTGRSADKAWWRVITTDGGVSLAGWVSGDYVTADSSCDDVPVVDSAGGILDPTATPTPGSTGEITLTPAPCILITTTTVALRPDPSASRAPLAAIPAKTALVPLLQSADGQWWHVAYGDQTGWINGGGVMASASCAAVSTRTP